ncbi:MAG: nuclear transport factor 2 family protein [Bacteroidota bacterium]
MTNFQDAETLARKCIELFNKRTVEWVDTCYAENVEWFELPLPSTPSGQHGNRAFLRNIAQRLLSLFPDRQMTINNLVAKDNCVAMELEWKGAAAVSFGTFKMGSLVRYRVASFLTFSDGLIITQIDYCVPIQSGAA